MRTIYCYHFEEQNIDREANGKSPVFKIGDTSKVANTPEEAALMRISEQDGTSTYEKPSFDWAIEAPKDFRPEIEHVDKEFHKFLSKNGIYKVRDDKDREWFAFELGAEQAKCYCNEFLFGVHAPNSYNMRPHQKEACDKIVKSFSNGSDAFLLAAKMRFGKNFTFLNAVRQLGYKNVLVLTYRPAVFASLQEDIESHVLFADFEYTFFKDTRERLSLSEKKTNIVVCSAQLAGYTYNAIDYSSESESSFKLNKKNIKFLSKVKWDLIVTDECHYGANTQNFKSICDALKCNRILYISGTPFKTLSNFDEDDRYMFTYLDEQNTPNNTMAKLRQYGISMPQPLIDYYNKNEEIADYPRMAKIFAANDEGIFGEKCSYIAKQLLDAIITRDFKSFDKEIKHAFIMLNNKNACKACTNYINEVYGRTFVGIDCSNDVVDTDELKQIIGKSNKAGKGTVSFSCGRFREGTSIPEWNCIVMLNDGESPENYFQAMFRGQTPNKKEAKTDFYVIDYNPNRLLCMNHNMIHEIPVDKKDAKKVMHQSIAREWLKAAPIIIINDDAEQTHKEVKYSDIEKAFFSCGELIQNKFAASFVFNRNQYICVPQEGICYALDKNRQHVLNKDNAAIVTDNQTSGGKNKASYADEESKKPDNDTGKKEKSDKYTISELVNYAKEFSRYLSRYIVTYKCKTYRDIVKSFLENENNQQKIFNKIMWRAGVVSNKKIPSEIFKILIEGNVYNEVGFDNVISDLWVDVKAIQRAPSAKEKHIIESRWNLFD